MTKTIDPLTHPQFDNLLKFAIAPRPICFASTVDKSGKVNLSPFSYFNLMSQRPPICVFSPLRRMRDGSTKHTLDNIQEVPEVVINIVNYAMVQQQSLASTEYERGVDEFIKSGFTPLASELVSPPRVAESPVQLECKVRQVVELADIPGAGNLVLAEVVRMHIHDTLLGIDDRVDQAELDLVARLGGDWYCRVTTANLFEVAKPLRNRGIGVDQLPQHIRQSPMLTGNHLGKLGNVEVLPTEDEIDTLRTDPETREILDAFIGDKATLQIHLHRKAAALLDGGEVTKAWKTLLLI
ncbi:flavin reductase family protein [Parapedobacter sp. 10938]|uniref:flavin reductase family protein n=1 Tax=Parapedobacter flavus TaxID=3110225 RepID=UPI002DB8A55A|nr:flavin reductase family protein [Parapedobacter sp. 10938]MEC3879678.1 flavin reductase family protein [Parapedobacter sp. 10938]